MEEERPGKLLQSKGGCALKAAGVSSSSKTSSLHTTAPTDAAHTTCDYALMAVGSKLAAAAAAAAVQIVVEIPGLHRMRDASAP